MWRSDRLRELRGRERAAFYRYRRLRTVIEADPGSGATKAEMVVAKRDWEDAVTLLHSTARGGIAPAVSSPQMAKERGVGSS